MAKAREKYGAVKKNVESRRYSSVGSPWAIPYGILTNDMGWVSVGHDTATFAVETLRRWWRGQPSLSWGAPLADYGRWWRTAAATACGNGSCKSSLTTPSFRSAFVTFRPAQASGTKHRMFCHPELARSPADKSRGDCEPHRPRRKAAWRSGPSWTKTATRPGSR